MRRKEKLDKNWLFHRGDIGFVAKTVAGSGKISGVTNTLKEEGTEPFAGALRAAKIMRASSRVSAEQEKLTDEELSWVIFGNGAPVTLNGWEPVDLPHDFRLEAGYEDRKELYNQGHIPNGIGWYRKTFYLEKDVEGSRINLEFDGVMRCAAVWFNGCFLGEHYSGYYGFHYDVTELAKYGEEGLNVVLVKADTTTGDEGWWYEGGGIYRHVWLNITSDVHIKRWGVYIRSKIDGDDADINIETTVENDSFADTDVTVCVSIQDPNGETIRIADSYGNCAAFSSVVITQNCHLTHPVRWDVDSPELYKAIVEIVKGNKSIDRYETTFGIREIEYRAGEGFFLNGRKLMLKGVCAHQDFAGVGVALPDDVINYKIKRLCDMGANAYRSSHHPATIELLEECDHKGILVMDENRVIETSPFRLEDLKEMILRGRNHPCIFSWSLSNEETFSGSYQAKRIIKKYVEIVRKLDPDRFLVSAEAFVDSPAAGAYQELYDIFGINYPETPANCKKYEEIRKLFPKLPVMNTESVSAFTTRSIGEDEPSRGHCSNYGTHYTNRGILEGPNAGGLSTPYRTMDFYNSHPESGGIFIWTAFDYRGEAKPWVARQVSCNFGAMDFCGFPKEAYYYYQSIFREEPMVHIWLHWNYEMRKNRSVEVRISTNCDEVELRLNNKSMGKKVKAGHWISWDVDFETGRLEAIGYRQGIKAAYDVRRTAGKPYRLVLKSDREELKANGESVAFVTVTVVDKNDVPVPDAENYINIDVSGNGRLLGLGNGDPDCRENDKAEGRRAFGGCLMALVQSGERSGKIVVKAFSQMLLPGAVQIIVR